MKSRRACWLYLPDAGVADPNHVEERGHDLGQELDALETQGLEDEGDGLYDHGVVVGERWVPQDAHQRDDGHGWIKLIQRQVAHVDQHLARAVVGFQEKQNRGGLVRSKRAMCGRSFRLRQFGLNRRGKRSFVEVCWCEIMEETVA